MVLVSLKFFKGLHYMWNINGFCRFEAATGASFCERIFVRMDGFISSLTQISLGVSRSVERKIISNNLTLQNGGHIKISCNHTFALFLVYVCSHLPDFIVANNSPK